MLTPQITAQVKRVLEARQREDKAYRAVIAITDATLLEEAERLVEEHERLIRATRREEFVLANLTIEAAGAVTT